MRLQAIYNQFKINTHTDGNIHVSPECINPRLKVVPNNKCHFYGYGLSNEHIYKTDNVPLN